jgi:hypothetical protein
MGMIFGLKVSSLADAMDCKAGNAVNTAILIMTVCIVRKEFSCIRDKESEEDKSREHGDERGADHKSDVEHCERYREKGKEVSHIEKGEGDKVCMNC